MWVKQVSVVVLEQWSQKSVAEYYSEDGELALGLEQLWVDV